MTGIWRNAHSGWELMSPTGFPDEATLHSLVEEAIHVLPLSGAPQLVVVGREVQLGPGFADLVAIDQDGRVAIIEIKLARNAEARRAVVSQVLSYAAHLHGMDVRTLERNLLWQHLSDRGYTSLQNAIESNDQEGSFDAALFAEGLNDCLAEGSFRLVMVLDSAPEELAVLAGYLESVANKVIVDLVTVSLYRVGDSEVLVPQRVDPERLDDIVNRVRASRGQLTEGAESFVVSYQRAAPEAKEALDRLVDWARGLESEGLVKLSTYRGLREKWTLLPRLKRDDAGLVTIWHDRGPALQFWRSVFERRAPSSIEPVEHKLGCPIGKGTMTRAVDDGLLALLTQAYRTAARPAPS